MRIVTFRRTTHSTSRSAGVIIEFEALRHLDHVRPDLLVLDLGLPGITTNEPSNTGWWTAATGIDDKDSGVVRGNARPHLERPAGGASNLRDADVLCHA